MFLIDDLLLAPFRGFVWVVDKIDKAARDEIAGETDAITEKLREMYLMLESGRLSESEFDEQERRLLDRLDAIRARDKSNDDSEDGDDDDEEASGDDDEEDEEGEDDEGAEDEHEDEE